MAHWAADGYMVRYFKFFCCDSGQVTLSNLRRNLTSSEQHLKLDLSNIPLDPNNNAST
jgi:hypothetical protein